MTSRTMAAVAALLAMAGLVGCDSDGDAQPQPSPSRTTAAPVPDVPTTGPENSPITWELDRGIPPSDPAVSALQRYIAYDTYVTSLLEGKRDGEALARGYADLATGNRLREITDTTTGAQRGGTWTGPLWYRVSLLSAKESSVTVALCEDSRHHVPVGDTAEEGDKPFAKRYVLRDVQGSWKVSDITSATAAERARCRAWDVSGHTP